MWVVGLLVLAVLAVSETSSRGRTGTDAYRAGLVVGALIFGLGVAFVVVFVVARVRRNDGHLPIDWAWSLPIAAALLVVAAAGTPGPTSPTSAVVATPAATTPRAQSYDKISSPYTLGPTTPADASLVANLTSSVGQSGISEVSVVRILDTSSTLVGYLVVISAPGASSDANAAYQGMLDGLRDDSISPTSATIDGRAVSTFTAGQSGGVVWLDGDFFVEVVATDSAGASQLAKAVLDAR